MTPRDGDPFLRWIDESLRHNRAVARARLWTHPPRAVVGLFWLPAGTPDGRGVASLHHLQGQRYVNASNAEATRQALESQYIRLASDKNFEW